MNTGELYLLTAAEKISRIHRELSDVLHAVKCSEALRRHFQLTLEACMILADLRDNMNRHALGE